MYVRTHDWLGQEPMFSGPFGGLGTNSFPAEIQKFIDTVGKHPKNYKPLLLAINFDYEPEPGYFRSKALADALGKLKLLSSADTSEALLSKTGLKQIVRELMVISDFLRKRDKDFQRLIDAERKLRNEMMRTADGIKPEKALEPFLLKASLISPWAEDLPLQVLGQRFAAQMLPAKLSQRLGRSAVSIQHYIWLGIFLRMLSQVKQGKDPAFKQRVEQEKKKSP